MADVKSSGIIPLNDSNYPTWKIQVRMALMKDGLWNIVNGKESAPGNEHADQTKFMTRRDKALAQIVLSIQPSLLYLLGDPEDPVEVWKKLENQYQKKTWANKLELRRKLFSLRLKDGESVQQHVKALTEVFDTLSVIGDPITEEDRVVHLLASLPEAYDMIVTALESSSNVPVMETVIERLLHEERKMKERDGDSGDSGKVFAAYRAKRVFKCHYCGKPGHLKRDCRIRFADERREKASDSGPREKVNQALRKNTSGEEEDVLLTSQALSVRMTSNWIIDSGASSHMCNDEQLFTKMEILRKPLEIVLGDGYVVKSQQQGTVSLMMKLPGNESRKCNLRDVLYVPNLSYNLVSVSKAVNAGKIVEFDGKHAQIKSVEGKLTGIGTRIGNLYYMDCYDCRKDCINISTQNNGQDIWHRRFGHLGIQNLQKLTNEKMVDGLDCDVTTDTDLCEPCIGGKHHKIPFPKSSSSHSKNPLDLVHSDVCGKMGEKSMGGAEYFLTFVDDKTRYVWVYPLKRKSDVFEKFKLWKTMAEKSSGCVLKTLRTDNGGEFISAQFGRYLCSEGIYNMSLLYQKHHSKMESLRD